MAEKAEPASRFHYVACQWQVGVPTRWAVTEDGRTLTTTSVRSQAVDAVRTLREVLEFTTA